MNLLPFLVAVCVTSTVFDQSMGDIWEDDAVSPKQVEMYEEDRFVASTSRFVAPKYRVSYNYRSAQREPSEDIVIVKSFSDRIVGGTEAEPGEIPWQASVRIFNEIDETNCGAVIIDPFWLLSAAHCFEEPSLSFQVTVGEYNLNDEDPEQQTFDVDTIYNHEQYDWNTVDNDIALIRIKPSRDGNGITYGEFVQPISLPQPTTYLDVGTKLLVSGWGGLLPSLGGDNDPQEYPVVLKKATISLIDQETCKQLYYYTGYTITDNMFCAGYLDEQADSCQGDSGGPVAYTSDGSNVLIGIVSFGQGCAQKNYPGVYTRVSSFLGWIQSTMQSNSRNIRQPTISTAL